jgi:hypothetical protein
MLDSSLAWYGCLGDPRLRMRGVEIRARFLSLDRAITSPRSG